MREFFLVLKFELITMLKKKSFVISTVLVVLGAFLLMGVLGLFMDEENNRDDTALEDFAGDKDIMMIYDEQHVLKDAKVVETVLNDYEIRYVDDMDTMKNAIINEDASAGFVVHDETNFTYYVKNSSLMDMTNERISALLQQQYQVSELKKLNYDVQKINAIYHVTITSDTAVLGTDGSNNYFYTYALVFVLYMMILVYGNQIGVGVASEKSNRAIEILTTSCSPNALIFGKVIAGAVAGVLQTILMVGSVLLAYQLNAESLGYILDPYLHIPSQVLLTFTLFGVLGYLLFSFLFGAIGAMCSKVEEVNGATLPFQLLIIAVFAISMFSLQMPDSTLSQIAMYVPLSSWMCMFVNVAVGSVSWMEIAVSLAILAATTLATGFFGAKLYRRGTLTYGNSINLKNILRWLHHNKS